LIIVLQTDSAEFGLTIAAIPVVLFLLLGCGIAVQREIKWCVWSHLSPRGTQLTNPYRLMTISLTLMVAAETYFGARGAFRTGFATCLQAL
jgi:hypothetical protein